MAPFGSCGAAVGSKSRARRSRCASSLPVTVSCPRISPKTALAPST